MVLIRSLIYFICLVISIIILGVAAALSGILFKSETSDKIATYWGKLNAWLLKTICGLKVEIIGAENLPNNAHIVMAKHQSAWETIFLRGYFRPNQSWILKKELTQIPIFGWALKHAKSIPIDRSAGRQAVKTLTDDGIRYLEEGRTVIIFPEGTRTPPGSRRKYNIGGGILAQKSKFPVIPIAHNSGVFWSRNSLKKYPGTIQMIIGKEITTTDKKASEIIREVEEWIETQQELLPKTRD